MWRREATDSDGYVVYSGVDGGEVRGHCINNSPDRSPFHGDMKAVCVGEVTKWLRTVDAPKDPKTKE